MSKPKSIQLDIASPCHEDWSAMSREEKGRLCGQCQKTVIDFTTWSDNDLFSFFSKNTTSVCGRFFPTQLKKELHIPPQPASRLYRIAIACGLTVMFAQVPESHAMVKQQVELLSSSEYDEDGDGKENSKTTGSVRGKVVNENGEAVQGVSVQVTMNGKKKASVITDKNGKYIISGLAAGKYIVMAILPHSTAPNAETKIVAGQTNTINLTIEQYDTPTMGIVAMPEPAIMGDVAPVRDTTRNNDHFEKGKVKVKR